MSSNCNCPLNAQQEVAFEGNLDAKVIFVLESPGREELIKKRPAVGEAGQRWEEVINEVGFQREDVFIINPSRCRLDKKALGAAGVKKVIAACRGALVTAIQHIKPKIVVACGGIASHALLGVPINGVKKRRGRWEYSSEFDCQVLHTYHPSFTLRDPSQLPYFKQDMQELRRVVNNNFDIQRHEDVRYIEVDSIRFLLDKNPEVVGFDTETQGLKWFDDDFVLISYSVSDEKGKAYQIVLWEEGTEEDYDKQIIWNRDGADVPVYIKKARNYAQKMIELQELCGNKSIKKYVMTSYDEHVLESQGIIKQEGFVLDVQIGAHVLNSDVYRNAHLADLEASFSDIDSSYNYSFAETYRKEDMLWSLKQDRESFMLYASADADGVRRVGLKVKEELMKNSLEARYYVKLVHPVTKTVLYNMSKNGMLIDMANLPKVSANISEERDRLEAECLDLVPDAVKEMAKHKNQLKIVGKKRPLNRRLFIADTLFSPEGFGLKPLGYTGKAKEPKTDQDTLRQLKSKANKRVREFIDTKFERDEYHTLYTRYIKNIEKYVAKDNRVHPSMSTTFTVTGRCGARSINSMNLPKRGKQAKLIRSLFIAPPGSYILNVDASQCLVPETQLMTIDGTKSLLEVVENKIPVLSCDKDNRLSFQPVTNAWCSGVKKIWRLTFEDGSYVDCSALHQFKTYGGEFKRTEQLRVGDRFTHVCSNISADYPSWCVVGKRSMPGYPKIQESQHRKHRLAGAFMAGRPLSSVDFIHHKDKNRKNWTPSNLKLMSNSEHSSLHNKGEGNPRWGDRSGEEKSCPVCGKSFYVHPSQKSYVTCSKKCAGYFFHVRHRIQKICPVCGENFEVVPSKGYQICCSHFCADVYCAKTVKQVATNHKLISIEKREDRRTYQIEVETNHTYILANGLISKNSELRWIAHESQDARMLEAFRNDEDLHTTTAVNMIQLAGKVPEDLTKEEMKEARQAAKPKNFGLSYLMSAWGYKEYALNDYGISMTKAQAIADRNAWFMLYPGVAEWHEKCIREMYRDGGVRHAFGRFRHLPNLFSNSDGKRHAAEREGVNGLIQGPSSDAVLLAGKEMYEDGFIDRPEIKLINFVHDNLTFEVRGTDAYIESLAREVVDRMSNSDFPDFEFSLSVPMKADAELGTSLADLEELVL